MQQCSSAWTTQVWASLPPSGAGLMWFSIFNTSADCWPFLSRLWGNPNHLQVVAKTLRERHPEESLHILVAKANSGSFTYDGISTGGERVFQEIEEEIEKLSKQGQVIRRISLVGYSLGGLVARYAVGLLSAKGIFERITPVVSIFSTYLAVLWYTKLCLIGIWLTFIELYHFRISSSRRTNATTRMA